MVLIGSSIVPSKRWDEWSMKLLDIALTVLLLVALVIFVGWTEAVQRLLLKRQALFYVHQQCVCPPDQKCTFGHCITSFQCPQSRKYGQGPPESCDGPSDPLNKPKSKLESWFTKDIFNDLFPKANLGWGPTKCWPYSYEAFVIASRYFPEFTSEAPENGYTAEENYKRDLAAFFSHAIQETGENDLGLYSTLSNKDMADACFYRGGFYNWFERGPISDFLRQESPGHDPKDGARCLEPGRYCWPSEDYPCYEEKDGEYFKGCYFGRGPLQLSYNFNYGLFQLWMKNQGIKVDLLKHPNLIMTKLDPPLAIMASLWFYMTPQPPKPAMHDIIMGNWKSSDTDSAAGYRGAIFGPTSLVINNECTGEDPDTPGGPGESRRIKAFKWFSKYFGFRLENDTLLSCKAMKVRPFSQNVHPVSYAVKRDTIGQDGACDCEPANFSGRFPYYAPGFYPRRFVDLNERIRLVCVADLYANPGKNKLTGQRCLKFPPMDVTTPSPWNPQTTPSQLASSPRSTSSPLINTTSGTKFACPGPGLFSDPKSCDFFYQCTEACLCYRMACPAGLQFNEAIRVCDWPRNVSCVNACVKASTKGTPGRTRLCKKAESMYPCTALPKGAFFRPKCVQQEILSGLEHEPAVQAPERAKD